MKKIIFLLVVLIGLAVLYAKSDKFRVLVDFSCYKLQKGVESVSRNDIDKFGKEITKQEESFKELKAKREQQFQSLEEERAKYDDDLKQHCYDQGKIKWFRDAFSEKGYPDPLTGNFDDQKYENMALKVNGKTFFVREAVTFLKERQAEFDQQQKGLDETRATIESHQKNLDDLDAQCVKIENAIKDMKKLQEENEQMAEAMRIQKKIDELTQETEKTNLEFQKLNEEARDSQNAEEKVRQEEKEQKLYESPDFKMEIAAMPSVEEKPAQTTTDVPDAETPPVQKDSEEDFDYLWEQMQEQMNTPSAPKEK